MRKYSAFIAIILAPVAFGLYLYLFGTFGFWFPGLTPRQTARILIEDSKTGGRGLIASGLWGDALLDPLRDVSKDFRSLDAHSALRVADVLAQNASAKSAAISSELFDRTDTMAKLVGAVGLAAHKKLPDAEFSHGGFLHEILSNDENIHMAGSDGQLRRDFGLTFVQLALLAAQHSASRTSVPDLLSILEKARVPYHIHMRACSALGAIKDKRAIPGLEEAMMSPHFHVVVEAFRALVALDDERAIPLAIARISPDAIDTNSGLIVKELVKLTKQDFGFDRAKWGRWWSERK